jgi:peptidoglycan/LPS O-acetylase OafA/YrhL
MTPASLHTGSKQPRVRLEFLDGLRGLAALYVVFFHVYHPLADDVLREGALRWAMVWAAAGRYAVAVFIVLSGFVLMLPITRSSDKNLNGGFAGFLRRRARRILPPYFASLALSLLLVWLFERQLSVAGRYGNALLPAFGIDNLIAHALLLHNLSDDWIFKINSALWSVATEWQIYLFFAIGLLPLAKRVPVWLCVPIGVLAGVVIHTMLGVTSAASFWFIGLFAMGMLSSELAFGQLRWALPWLTLAALAFSAFMLSFVLIESGLAPTGQTLSMMILDMLIGLTTLCFIVAGVERPALIHWLELPIFRALGRFSYSLYLTHFPVLTITDALLRDAQAGPSAHLAGMLLLGVPVAIALSIAMYWLAERPLINRRSHPSA